MIVVKLQVYPDVFVGVDVHTATDTREFIHVCAINRRVKCRSTFSAEAYFRIQRKPRR
jgi:hypothetical protein